MVNQDAYSRTPSTLHTSSISIIEYEGDAQCYGSNENPVAYREKFMKALIIKILTCVTTFHAKRRAA